MQIRGRSTLLTSEDRRKTDEKRSCTRAQVNLNLPTARKHRQLRAVERTQPSGRCAISNCVQLAQQNARRSSRSFSDLRERNARIPRNLLGSALLLLSHAICHHEPGLHDALMTGSERAQRDVCLRVRACACARAALIEGLTEVRRRRSFRNDSGKSHDRDTHDCSARFGKPTDRTHD